MERVGDELWQVRCGDAEVAFASRLDDAITQALEAGRETQLFDDSRAMSSWAEAVAADIERRGASEDD